MKLAYLTIVSSLAACSTSNNHVEVGADAALSTCDQSPGPLPLDAVSHGLTATAMMGNWTFNGMIIDTIATSGASQTLQSSYSVTLARVGCNFTVVTPETYNPADKDPNTGLMMQTGPVYSDTYATSYGLDTVTMYATATGLAFTENWSGMVGGLAHDFSSTGALTR